MFDRSRCSSARSTCRPAKWRRAAPLTGRPPELVSDSSADRYESEIRGALEGSASIATPIPHDSRLPSVYPRTW